MLIEQNVLAQGMCFPFAYQKAEEWFEAHFTKGSKGRRPSRHPDLNDKSKFKVVHGTVTDKWKKPPKPVVHGWVEMGDLVFDDQSKIMKPDGVPKDVYYDMYQPEIYREFTAEEAVVNCAMYGGEGPWDDDLYAQMQDRDAWMNEATKYDSKLSQLMSGGLDGIEQAFQLADAMGIPTQELPWTLQTVSRYIDERGEEEYGSGWSKHYPKLLEPTGWSIEKWRDELRKREEETDRMWAEKYGDMNESIDYDDDDEPNTPEAKMAWLVMELETDQALMMFEMLHNELNLDLLATEIAKGIEVKQKEKWSKPREKMSDQLAAHRAWQAVINSTNRFITGDGINRSFLPSVDSYTRGNWDDTLGMALRQTAAAWKKKNPGHSLNEATKHDKQFKTLMDAGFDGIKQAMELADSLGIPSQELPWDLESVDIWVWESGWYRKPERALGPTGWTKEDYLKASNEQFHDYEASLGYHELERPELRECIRRILLEITATPSTIPQESLISLINYALDQEGVFDFTEKFAGTHIELVYQPDGHVDARSKAVRQSGGDFSRPPRVAKTIGNAIELLDPPSEPKEFAFEYIATTDRPDYINYLVGDKPIAIEYSGMMTINEVEILNSSQEEIGFMNKDQVTIASFEFSADDENILLDLSQEIEAGKIKRNRLKEIGAEVSRIITSAIPQSFVGGPIEGLMVQAGEDIYKIPNPAYADIQRLQAPIYAVFSGRGGLRKREVKNRLMNFSGNDRIVSNIDSYLMAVAEMPSGFRSFFSADEIDDLLILLDGLKSGDPEAGAGIYDAFNSRVNDRNAWRDT